MLFDKSSIGTVWAGNNRHYVTIDDVIVYNYSKVSYATKETIHKTEVHIIFYYETDFGKEVCCLTKESFVKAYSQVVNIVDKFEAIFANSPSY